MTKLRFTNLHTHTVFSDGKNTVEEMVKQAINLGFSSIGISDHSETDCDLSYCMRSRDYEKYFAEINRVKNLYSDKIDVLTGMELDYCSEIDRRNFDYIISSVHYLIEKGNVYAIDHARDIQLDCINNCFSGDQNAFAEKYYQTVIQNVRKNRPDIVGHIDVITKYGVIDEQDEKYKEIALSAVDEVMKYCRVIEINTGAIFRKCRTVPYPNPYILKRISENGGGVTINGDSHCTEALDTYFEESVELLRSVGFKSHLILTKDGFSEEKI